MPDDPVITDIENLGLRRLAGCAVRFALVVLLGGLVLGLVVRQTQDAPTRAAFAFAVSGLIFGFASSILTEPMRKLLRRLFVVFPLVAAILVFACRTLLGWHKELPLMIAAAPVMLTLGFVVGQFRWRAK